MAEEEKTEGEGEGGTSADQGAVEDLLRRQEAAEEEAKAYEEQVQGLLEGVEDTDQKVEVLMHELVERGKKGDAQERRIKALEELTARGAVERAQLEILGEQPELREHLELVGEDEPEKMRKRAEQLKKLRAETMESSRASTEREVAGRFGVPLGSSAEGRHAPEKVKAREEAVGSGDAGEVARQVIEDSTDALLG